MREPMGCHTYPPLPVASREVPGTRGKNLGQSRKITIINYLHSQYSKYFIVVNFHQTSVRFMILKSFRQTVLRHVAGMGICVEKTNFMCF